MKLFLVCMLCLLFFCLICFLYQGKMFSLNFVIFLVFTAGMGFLTYKELTTNQ